MCFHLPSLQPASFLLHSNLLLFSSLHFSSLLSSSLLFSAFPPSFIFFPTIPLSTILAFHTSFSFFFSSSFIPSLFSVFLFLLPSFISLVIHFLCLLSSVRLSRFLSPKESRWTSRSCDCCPSSFIPVYSLVFLARIVTLGEANGTFRATASIITSDHKWPHNHNCAQTSANPVCYVTYDHASFLINSAVIWIHLSGRHTCSAEAVSIYHAIILLLSTAI